MSIKKKQMIKNIDSMLQTNNEVITLLSFIDEKVVLEVDILLKEQISTAIKHLNNMNDFFRLIKQSM